ncbi:MAG: fumarylacetoacetate hydrolase family protein [Candidatus Bathyarchaeota archaeon]|nr:fumarylacetoacetate hydrolase family protein [Candidatus Bathyarchaeota archaeon]MCX8177132.1 fumarylacetoacetate hydrolase family protein [Candidatus Bathyarchaeota archaeon]MDW8193698.1 fumarylacetoacetate hydrolase family protein [Nitrososphaerota archaeon]
MRLVRYLHENREEYGVLSDEGMIISLTAIADNIKRPFPKTLEGFIKKSGGKMAKLEAALNSLPEKVIKQASMPIGDVKMLAPLIRPPKIICLGLNYFDHIEEDITKRGKTVPDEPVIFLKPSTTIIGPGEPIVKPSFVKQLDYEAELAIIIGAYARNVPVEEAGAHIFGYTILNDVSARDVQLKDGQWTRGKSFDTFAPIGPCIVTGNQLTNPMNLRIRTWVNGELRQNSSTKNMVFNVYEVVHHLSRVMTLEPCDIIATGTPSGVGIALKPEPKFLKKGDVVTIEIEGIGVLENFVEEEAA